MAGGGGSTGGIGAQSPASGGFGGNMGGGFGGNMGGMGGQQQTMPYQPAIGMPGGQGGQTTYQNPNPQVGGPAQLGGNEFSTAPAVQPYSPSDARPTLLRPQMTMPYQPGGVGLGSAAQQGNFNPFAPVSQEERGFVSSVLQGPRGNYDGRNSMTAPANGFGGIEQDQDFRNFRSQHDDLSRQMNEYMQKAPMYQQLQELQGKMQGVQSRYAPQQQQMQRPQQRGRYPNFNPMQQQLGGLAALLGGLGRR
jgi:hypothetical protein